MGVLDWLTGSTTTVTKTIIPAWVKTRRKELVALTGVSEFLVRFAHNPEGLIIGIVLSWFVDAALYWAAVFGAQIRTVQQIGIDAFGGAFGAAFGSVGDALAGIILGLIRMVNGLALDLAVGAGPAGPVVVLLIWAASILVAIYGFVYGVKALLILVDLITGRVPQ